MKREVLPGWILVLLPAVALAIAALVPIFKGRSMNVTFIALAVLWVILGLAIAKAQKKSQSESDGPK